MKVLIVEECPMEGKMLADMVLDQGYSVLGNAGSYKEAFGLWSGKKPDLCIYDDKFESDAHNWHWLFGMITKRPLPLIVSAKEVRPEIKQLNNFYSHLPKPASTRDLDLAVSDSVVKFEKRESTEVLPADQVNDRLFIKDHLNNYRRVLIKDILWAKGEGNYTRIVTANRDYLIRAFLGDFLKKIPAATFARAHKSYLINLEAITEIRPANVIIRESEIPLAKSYRSQVMTRFQTY